MNILINFGHSEWLFSTFLGNKKIWKNIVESEEDEEWDDFIDDMLEFCKRSYRSLKSGLLKPFEIPEDRKWLDSTPKNEDFFTAVYRDSRKEFFDIPEDETKFFNDAERIR